MYINLMKFKKCRTYHLSIYELNKFLDYII